MKRKLKLTYIFTHRIRWVAFEWTALYIDRSKFEVDYVILNETDPMVSFLKQHNIPVTTTTFLDYADTSVVVKFIYDHLKSNQTDIVHTHFFAGHFTGIQAAFYANVPVRILTRHHAGIKEKRHAYNKFRLLWDMATDIVGLTNEGRKTMISDGIAEEKITIIPHGFDIKAFENISKNRIEQLRKKYIPQHEGPVIGVMSRYIKLKGINYIIDAFEQVLKKHSNALLILAGTGTYSVMGQEHGDNATHGIPTAALSIKKQLEKLPPHTFIEIPFEEDLFALYRLYDVLVHVPIAHQKEAFGQVFIETMLSKVPSVITRTAVATDYAIHRENAWVVGFKNSEQIAEGIIQLLENKKLREKIIDNAFQIATEYTVEQKTKALEQLYEESYQRNQSK